jgi:hypothetical protein
LNKLALETDALDAEAFFQELRELGSFGAFAAAV